MKKIRIFLFTALLLPNLVQGQTIGKVPLSDVTVNKSVIGTMTEYSLTIYDRLTGYNGEIRLGDYDNAVSLLVKLGDEAFCKMGRIGLNNGFGDSAEYKEGPGVAKWNIYRQNGQTLYLSLYEAKVCKEVILKDGITASPHNATAAIVHNVINDLQPSFYLKRSAKRMEWCLGLSAASVLTGTIYTYTSAINAENNVQGGEASLAVISVGTSIAALCTMVGSIIDLHRAGTALERIQITNGGVTIKF